MTMIKFNKVTIKFADGTVAFSDLSFAVEEGDLTLITGPSGSGKTTVMRLLIKEYSPTQGEIIFEGKNIQTLKRKQICQHRRRVGVAFQDFKLIPELNVWENIALPLYIRGEKQEEVEERVTDLLKLVELTEKGLMFPKQLSGGEAQRVSIARALATGPRLIFADEPTGNLDKTTSERIITLLKKINQLGTTLIIATHDPLVINQLQAKTINLGIHNVNETARDQGETNDDITEKSKKPSDGKKKIEEKKEPGKKDQEQKTQQELAQEKEELKEIKQKELEQKEKQELAANKKPKNLDETSDGSEGDKQSNTKSAKQIDRIKAKSAQELNKAKTKSKKLLKRIASSVKEFKKNKQPAKSRFVKEKKSKKKISFEAAESDKTLQTKSKNSAQSDSN